MKLNAEVAAVWFVHITCAAHAVHQKK